jgi:CRISPR-associated protein Cas8a1/Csx13
LIAENIAHGREWYEGFCQLMRSKQLSTAIGYERKGLKTMVDEVQWSHESDRKLVEAVHIAIRNRYGALAARAREKGEAIRFDREFGRMRTGLMRAKNAQTLRAELADLFVRGGINSVLQQDWQRVLTLFAGKDWQRARDLALLALASYTGKGAEEIESAEQTYDGEE